MTTTPTPQLTEPPLTTHTRNALVVVPSRSQEQLTYLVQEIANTCAAGFPITPVTERSSAPLKASGVHQIPPESPATETKNTREIGHLFTIVGDVGDPKGVVEIRETIMHRFGRLDRVIAGFSRFWGKGVTTKQSFEEWESALHDMVGVHFVCVREFLPLLRDNKRGQYSFYAPFLL